MKVTTGQVLKYTMLPGFIPRIMAFISSGFAHIALYIAYVYRSVKLLPPDHPYLNPQNIGKFGIRHVIFEAKRHLVISKDNIDQVIIFTAIMTGVVVLLMQFASLIMALMMPQAFAFGPYVASFFVTANPEYDIAFRLLDLTFGFTAGSSSPGAYSMFDSCVAKGTPCQLAFAPGSAGAPVKGPTPTAFPTFPYPFHDALHTLFHFYNVGILVVAFIVGMYFVVTIIGETAQSGTPFGKRFNGMWAPLRLIYAIALLTPVAFGINGAQLVTLYVAKWGSGLATNGWLNFATALNYIPINTTSGTPGQQLVATPIAPQINTVVASSFTALTCKYAEALMNRRDGGASGRPPVDAYQVFTQPDGTQSNVALGAPSSGLTFTQALANANYGDIVIRYGWPDPVHFAEYTGFIKPVCGELVFKTNSLSDATSTTDIGAYTIQEAYFEEIKWMWTDVPNNEQARNLALRYVPVDRRDPFAAISKNVDVTATYQYFNTWLPKHVQAAVIAQQAATWGTDYTKLGWGGAGIWYQTIAEYTGSLFAATYNLPTPHLYPEIMEYVREQRRIHDDFVEGKDRFNPILSNGKMIPWEDPRDMNMGLAYNEAIQTWEVAQEGAASNSLRDSILAMFGLDGLFAMQHNLDIHPMAQLIGVGRSLIESSVANLGFSFGAGLAGGLAGILGADLVGSVAASAASFAGQIAVIGLSIGFILFYILPFLPFIYFFFAVGGWVKGIFEAMVGLPLWAMAHIRIDGEGLPGPVAMDGYFLIFEIMVRPFLIVVGLIGGIAIFTAQVQVLNEIWQIVTSNVMGFDTATAGTTTGTGTGAGTGPVVGSIEYLRGHADRLFYTIIYTIIVYMLAMGSFKLIDLVPNNILRWMKSSVTTFGEQAGDPAGTLVQYSYMGSQYAIGPINQGIQGLAARAQPKLPTPGM